MKLEIVLILSMLFILIISVIAVLFVVIRLYKMHDVRNEDGQYAWMVPGSFSKVMENIVRTQELMTGSLAELTVHNSQISKLLGTHTDAALAMFEEMKQIRRERQNGQ